MRGFFLLSVGTYAAGWAWASVSLPERVPMHFGAGGAVQRWGSRAEALTVQGLIGLLCAVLLGGSAWWVGRASLSSRWVNLPNKPWWTATPEREARARRMLRRDLFLLGALTMALLTVIEFSLVQAANQPEPRMPVLGVAGMVVLLLAVVGYSLWLPLRRYRPDEI